MTRSKQFNFTQRGVAGLPDHDPQSRAKSTEYSDTAVQGLRLVVGKGGRWFAFRYTLASGRARYARIGTFPALGVAEARAEALEMRAVVDRGGDPLDERDRLKAMPTFGEFFIQEYLPFSRQVKRSAKDDESKFRLHLEKKFGALRLSAITPRDIQLHHAAMKAQLTPGTANRHLALLSAVFRKAVEWGRLERSPVSGIKAFKEDNVVQNFLSADQLARLFAALDADRNRTAAAALKLLALTGVRREEALQAEWRHVDLERGQWWLARTKAGKGRWVMLNEAAKALLAGLPSRGASPWVFPGREDDKPIVNVRKTLERGLAAAGLAHARIHDLRHAFASVAINQGATLYEVMHLLGHASSQVTQRYAHQADQGLRRASQAVANVIGAAMVEAGKEVEKEGSPA